MGDFISEDLKIMDALGSKELAESWLNLSLEELRHRERLVLRQLAREVLRPRRSQREEDQVRPLARLAELYWFAAECRLDPEMSLDEA